MKIRRASKKDTEVILRLNEESVPHVSRISKKELDHFFKIASHILVVEMEESVVGFMITILPGKNYSSLNYQFFNNHYKSFEYVDRIAIDEKHRGEGIGKALYNYLFEHADSDFITCEVNLKPPNPNSLAFHEKMGFAEKSKLQTDGGKKKVSLLVKKL